MTYDNTYYLSNIEKILIQLVAQNSKLSCIIIWILKGPDIVNFRTHCNAFELVHEIPEAAGPSRGKSDVCLFQCEFEREHGAAQMKNGYL